MVPTECAAHPVFCSTCAKCRWCKSKQKWEGVAQYAEAITLKPRTWLAARPSSDQTFAVGCTLCAQLASDKPSTPAHKWARFEITGDAIRMHSIKSHSGTEGHLAAVAAYAGGLSPTPCKEEEAESRLAGEAAKGGNQDLQGYVPRRVKFMDVIRGCFQGQSGGAYAASFPKCGELESPLISTGVLRDESPDAQYKMLTASAAVLDDEQQFMLRKAVRIAFSDDDRDQHRVLRVRVVWTNPRVGWAEFFGSLLKDYGFDAEDSRDATVAGLQRLCSSRRRPPGNEQGEPVWELDERLWDEVRRKIFCGATDGLGVALKAVCLMSVGTCPNLRYQFRDRPHTTRTVQKMVFDLCPESEEVRSRLITGPKSFARRVKASMRFREIWLRKQKEEPDALWAVCQDLGYAEQRYDSRSKPMAAFLLKLGPALEVLKEMANDVRKDHLKDAKWARDLLRYLSGPSGFLRLVLFAIDTDFAVAVHKLVRQQDGEQPDVATAASEVQACVDVCRVLFEHGRIFDKKPNGTYTNSLLQGFKGVSQAVLLANGERMEFGWPEPGSELLKDAVLHAKKLYKACSLFFSYNYPHHAWRMRFQAFVVGVEISDQVRRTHIREIAAKEGVDPERSWEQFFEAMPHVKRLFRASGDARRAWASYLDSFCRAKRHAAAWRPCADCIAPLVLTYIGIMDGTSDVERNFAQLTLVEPARARRHHTEQFLQDILKVRLHAPKEFREMRLASEDWGEVVASFLHAAQRKYAAFFGLRRLASRAMQPIPSEAKRELFLLRRPRWQRICEIARKTHKQHRVRRELWDEDVARLTKEHAECAAAATPSFADHVHISQRESDELLRKVVQVVTLKGVQYELYQREQEAAGLLTAPPPVVQAKRLVAPPQKKRRTVAGATPGPVAAPRLALRRKARAAAAPTPISSPAAASLHTAVGPTCPLPSAGVTVPPEWKGTNLTGLRVWFSKAAVAKHGKTWLYFRRQGILEKSELKASHRIRVKGELLSTEGPKVVTLSALRSCLV